MPLAAGCWTVASAEAWTVSESHQRFDLLRLHAIILVWGFTAILGRVIELPAIELVLLRCSIAALTLWVYLLIRDRGSLKPHELTPLGIVFQWHAIGGLMAAHWVLFFAAIKISSVSIAMTGLATMSLWTALIEPALVPGRRLQPGQFAFAICIVLAIAHIYGDQSPDNGLGLSLAIAAAILSAIFSSLNARYTDAFDASVITMHQMVGAALSAAGLCVVGQIWSPSWLIEPGRALAIPSAMDWGALILLGTVCTVYTYVEFVKLLSRLTVYTVLFANNLEPIYGILLGSLAFGDHRQMTPRFWTGATMIFAAVVLQTLVQRRAANRL